MDFCDNPWLMPEHLSRFHWLWLSLISSTHICKLYFKWYDCIITSWEKEEQRSRTASYDLCLSRQYYLNCKISNKAHQWKKCLKEGTYLVFARISSAPYINQSHIANRSYHFFKTQGHGTSLLYCQKKFTSKCLEIVIFKRHEQNESFWIIKHQTSVATRYTRNIMHVPVGESCLAPWCRHSTVSTKSYLAFLLFSYFKSSWCRVGFLLTRRILSSLSLL